MKKLILLLCGITVLLSGCDNDDNSTVYSITIMPLDHDCTAIATVGGSTVTEAKEGTIITLTATAGADFSFSRWVVWPDDVTLLPDDRTNGVTFTMPAEEVGIRAEFIIPPIPYVAGYDHDGSDYISVF
jgi:hypothetical protein